ncbi:methyltransferase domain-containing protein [Ochrobactrum sp. BTU2]|uniref:methyltransferase domain-containing protein n=1 Tax=Ochrobactrum sp. BTU2 TaxID=2856166 RepID=UPI002119DE07|nr:methyltransferase domain-containing protein [Ochrobactrum sp. BTU2]MCQ9147819.1 class I SAM-dependent methyltransferase [Ochrobactrum sp. BTU2]
MSGIKPNQQYWKTKSGADYKLAHAIREQKGTASYKLQEKWLTERLRNIITTLGRPIKLLDFGCGYGRIAHLCAEIGDIDYYGFDFSEAMVQPLLESPPAEYQADIHKRVYVGSQLPETFLSGNFDVVISISVLIHNDETNAREIISKLLMTVSSEGELILIENPLSSTTHFENIWHAGCWVHNFLEYIGPNYNVELDERIHPSHCFYIIRQRKEEESKSIDYWGIDGFKKYTSSAELFEEVIPQIEAATSTTVFTDSINALDIAEMFDKNEIDHSQLGMHTPENNDRRIIFEAMKREIILNCIGAAKYQPGNEEQSAFIERNVFGVEDVFDDYYVPWLKEAALSEGDEIIQIGCDTGGSTVALLPNVKHVHCLGMNDIERTVAEFRFKLRGLTNFDFIENIEDIVALPSKVNGVVFYSSLEHMPFSQCVQTLKQAWEQVEDEGWLCVIDTPNRLNVSDNHTSLLPFFNMLPLEVRLAYAERSPRREFATAFENKATSSPDTLIGWGSGISYHEFEIALGEDIHGQVVADGFETKLNELLGTTPDESITQLMLGMYANKVNRCFARRSLHFVVRKKRLG